MTAISECVAECENETFFLLPLNVLGSLQLQKGFRVQTAGF